MTTDFKALAAKAAELSNHNEETTIEYELPVAGKTVGRLIEYIELGSQKRKPYLGKAKAPAPKVKLTFELLSAKHVKEVEVEGVKREFANRVSIDMVLSTSDLSTFKKAYNKMKYGRDINHMAEMLGEAFILNIVHNTSEATKKTYANIEVETIGAPRNEDPIEGTSTPIEVRPPVSKLKLFIFDLPSKETWDSLFIDGSYTKKDDSGKETEVSKNWIQNMIKKAENFKGSALEQLIGGVDELPEFKDAELEATQAAKTEAPKDKKATKPVAEAASDEDLAALGM